MTGFSQEVECDLNIGVEYDVLSTVKWLFLRQPSCLPPALWQKVRCVHHCIPTQVSQVYLTLPRLKHPLPAIHMHRLPGDVPRAGAA